MTSQQIFWIKLKMRNFLSMQIETQSTKKFTSQLL